MPNTLVQREIIIRIKGPEELVDRIAQKVMVDLPTSEGMVRMSITGRKDWLDADWNVIPPEQIMAALRELKG